jgi:hypothetical protein
MSGGTDGKEQGAAPELLATFEDGIARFRAGDAVGAHGLFERAHRRSPGDPRVMSWYGLTLVLVERNSNLGGLYCDQALRISGPDPELLLNQARVYLALRQRERAVKAIQRGLAAAPMDLTLKAAQDSMGWRQRPVFPCLGRGNPLNRWLGQLRHKWSRRMHPVPDATPMTLGLLPDPPGSEPPRSA